jgi:hypothetical protein
MGRDVSAESHAGIEEKERGLLTHRARSENINLDMDRLTPILVMRTVIAGG